MNILSFNIIAENIKKEINQKCGLNLSQTRILLYFDNNNNQALKMGDLADNLKISLSTLSRQLQQKKTLNFVTITRSESDSSKTVVLNKMGLQKIDDLKKVLADTEKAMFAEFSAAEVATFTKMFNRLVEKSHTI